LEATAKLDLIMKLYNKSFEVETENIREAIEKVKALSPEGGEDDAVG